MDPLRIITKYNTRRLSETLLSSFLNYFLDPKEDHGFGYAFLEKFTSELDLIDKESIPSSRDSSVDKSKAFWSNSPEVRVCSEFNLGGRLGFIDSFIVVTIGDPSGKRKKSADTWIIGTEVKIHDSSAKSDDENSDPQLVRYCNGFKEIGSIPKRLDWLLNEIDDKELINEAIESRYNVKSMTLAYLVPTASKAWPDEVEKLRQRLYNDEQNKSENPRFVVIPWADRIQAKSDLDLLSKGESNSPSNHVADKSLTDVIRGLIVCQNLGLAPQPDEHALHLLRCVQYAATNDFKYVFSLQYEGEFPSNTNYRNALEDNDQIEVFNSLCESVRDFAPNANLFAKSRNTSIGIPKGSVSKSEKGDNTLCRIRTVTSYDPVGSCLNFVLLELVQDKNGIAAVLRKIECEFPLGISPILAEANYDDNLRHLNELNNEEVYLVELKKNAGWDEGHAWRENARKWFDCFFREYRQLIK